MIYGFALLFLIAALTMGIPAVRTFVQMSRINRNRASTTGWVNSTPSALGWMWTSSFGNVVRPRIIYETPSGTEMMFEIVTSSAFTFRRYEPGMPVEVVFDRAEPGNAYARPEWDVNLRELQLVCLFLALAFVLGLLGRLYHL